MDPPTDYLTEWHHRIRRTKQDRSLSNSRGWRRNTNEEDKIIPPHPPDSGVWADQPVCTLDWRMRMGTTSQISRSEDGPTDKYFDRLAPGTEQPGAAPRRKGELKKAKIPASRLPRDARKMRNEYRNPTRNPFLRFSRKKIRVHTSYCRPC
jgi:hypothetical protein